MLLRGAGCGNGTTSPFESCLLKKPRTGAAWTSSTRSSSTSVCISTPRSPSDREERSARPPHLPAAVVLRANWVSLPAPLLSSFSVSAVTLLRSRPSSMAMAAQVPAFCSLPACLVPHTSRSRTHPHTQGAAFLFVFASLHASVAADLPSSLLSPSDPKSEPVPRFS